MTHINETERHSLSSGRGREHLGMQGERRKNVRGPMRDCGGQVGCGVVVRKRWEGGQKTR